MRYFVALFAGALALLPSQAAAQQQHTDFSGRWIYDSAKSDHVTPQPMGLDAGQAPRSQAQPAEGGEGGGEPGEGGEGGEGGGMGGRFGGGYGGGFGGRRIGPRGPQSMTMEDRIRFRALTVLARPVTALDILQTDSTVTLITGADTLVLYPNEKKTAQVLPGGAKAETQSQWKDGDLRVERDLGSGMKLVQRFTLSGTKSYLWLYVTASNGRGNMQVPFLRVYYRPGGRP